MRKTIIGITTAFLFVAATLPAGANVQAGRVVHEAPVGGCYVQYIGTEAIVVIAVVDPAAITLSVTCHVTLQTWWGERDGHVGAVGVGGVAAGGGVLPGYDLGPYEVCTEIHASYLTGPPYHSNCH